MESNKEGYSTDDSTKRMRDEDEEEKNVGTKSRKIVKTPTKVKEDKLDKILRVMEEMKLEMSDMKGDTKALRREQREFKDEIMKLKQENRELKEKYDEIKQEKDEIKKELKEIRKNIEWVEKDKKKNNFVMSGMVIESNNSEQLKQNVTRFIEHNLQVKINVKAVHKLAERACLVELENGVEKQDVMQNKFKLKKLREQRIFIDNDLTRNERVMRKQIRALAEEERKSGKLVKIKFSKLIVDGQVWKWNMDMGKLEKPKNC